MKTHSRLSWIGLAAIALILAVPVGQSSAKGRDMARHLRAALDQGLAASGAPGVIAGVWKGGFVWTKAEGLADVAAKIPMRTDYVWRIGSVTKTFVATAVLRLCDKGVLSLDEPLSRFRPDFPKAGQITIRELLQHSSGVFTWDEDEATREAVFHHPDKDWNMETMIRIAAHKPFYCKPGTEYHYSNVGYFLLASVIEKATGMSVAQVIKKEITEPLGLHHTYMPDGPRYKDEVIHGYMSENGVLKDITGLRITNLINYNLAHTAGGMVSTLADLNVWVRSLANGRLLSPKMHRAQFQTIPNPAVKGAGYGLGVGTANGWIGHSGGVAGSMCDVYTYPKDDVVIIHYFNKLNPLNEKENTADIKAMSEMLMKMMRITVPENK